MQVVFVLKNYYGKKLFYPETCAADAIVAAFKAKTLTEAQIDALIAAGLSIDVVMPVENIKYQKRNLTEGVKQP